VFDGPIDPIWVENLNSVLDDNKKLTLNTGETIKLSSSMNILIEAENLISCTPATISRCGMIYMQDEQISVK
jgi:dynein heavy chain